MQHDALVHHEGANVKVGVVLNVSTLLYCITLHYEVERENHHSIIAKFRFCIQILFFTGQCQIILVIVFRKYL